MFWSKEITKSANTTVVYLNSGIKISISNEKYYLFFFTHVFALRHALPRMREKKLRRTWLQKRKAAKGFCRLLNVPRDQNANKLLLVWLCYGAQWIKTDQVCRLDRAFISIDRYVKFNDLSYLKDRAKFKSSPSSVL